ncbi:hypothetical protein [Thermofilum sp.]|jgi:hypothetical protein|uniref:hypothetical protein n=1 Tax=Thermofilum sp. TaxID=1961369 RepID=UPI002587A18F|nr:hypothetical protein [Thermofilum sp.]
MDIKEVANWLREPHRYFLHEENRPLAESILADIFNKDVPGTWMDTLLDIQEAPLHRELNHEEPLNYELTGGATRLTVSEAKPLGAYFLDKSIRDLGLTKTGSCVVEKDLNVPSFCNDKGLIGVVKRDYATITDRKGNKIVVKDGYCVYVPPEVTLTGRSVVKQLENISQKVDWKNNVLLSDISIFAVNLGQCTLDDAPRLLEIARKKVGKIVEEAVEEFNEENMDELEYKLMSAAKDNLLWRWEEITVNKRVPEYEIQRRRLEKARQKKEQVKEVGA